MNDPDELQEYDWEPVAARFWICLACGCLLSGIPKQRPVCLSNQVSPFQSFASGTGGHGGGHSGGHSGGHGSGTMSMQLFLHRQHTFVQTASSSKTFQNVVGSLQELSHADASVAIEMWHQVFPQMWDSMQEPEQASLVNPLERLLSQSYHRYQLKLPGGHGYGRNGQWWWWWLGGWVVVGWWHPFFCSLSPSFLLTLPFFSFLFGPGLLCFSTTHSLCCWFSRSNVASCHFPLPTRPVDSAGTCAIHWQDL
jgi:hypothetical protein